MGMYSILLCHYAPKLMSGRKLVVNSHSDVRKLYSNSLLRNVGFVNSCCGNRKRVVTATFTMLEQRPNPHWTRARKFAGNPLMWLAS